jgi:hypothetical protein
MTGLEVALALAAAFTGGLAVGVPLGAWPDRVLQERDAARAELVRARSDLRHQSELHIAAVQQLYDLDNYGPRPTYLEECDCPTCHDPFCPCPCHQ